MNNSTTRASSASVDALVFDFLLAATDAVLQERRAIINPIIKNPMTFRDSADFCRQCLQSWKKDLNKPLILEIYIFDPKMNKHYLMERWKFEYVKNTEVKEARQLTVINRRILTLLRSLYCFVRLMPGFNLINISQKPATLNFQLFEQSNSQPSSFSHEFSHYKFTPVSTSKGVLQISVRFITSQVVKDVLTNLNGGPASGVATHSRRNSRTAEENNLTAAIPIPSQQDPSNSLNHHHHDSDRERDRNSFTGKHMNARMSVPSSGTSLDATADNSSVSSSGGSMGGGGPMGSTPPLGNRFPRPGTSREARRSFHLPPHLEHGEPSALGEREESPYPHGFLAPGQQLGGGGGSGGTHSSPSHKAVSLDSQPHTLQNLIRAAETSRPGSQRGSPHHLQPHQHLQMQQQQQAQQAQLAQQLHGQQGYATEGVQQAGGFPQPSQGIRIANNQNGPSTSYGNSYSQQSTPPFSLGEIAAQHADRYNGAYPELTQESPPYPAFSTSLTSTSPHLPSSVMALIQMRNGTGGYTPGYTPGAGAQHGHLHGAFTAGNSKGRISPSGGMDFSDLKLRIAPLPSSPFAHADTAGARGRGISDLDNALVPAHSPSFGSRPTGSERGPSMQSTSQDKSGGGNNLSRSLAQITKHDSDNTLDAVLLQESQRRRLESGEGSDLLPRLSGDGRSGDGRHPSKDRSSGGSRDDPAFDMDFEEDMPFAWAESEIATSGSMIPAATDSVGAQLLYGLSKMSLQPPSYGQGQGQGFGALGSPQQFSYGNEGPSRYPGPGSSSSYTGAGLSGELLSKINDFKNLGSTFGK